MTPERLAEIQALHEAATSGPAQGIARPTWAMVAELLAEVERQAREIATVTSQRDRLLAAEEWSEVSQISKEVRVRQAAALIYDPEGVEIWMGARNQSLGDRTPVDLIAAGESERVLQVLDQLASGAFS